MSSTIQQFELNAQSIDQISVLVRDFSAKHCSDHKTYLRLVVEECLLNWMNTHLFEHVELVFISRFGHSSIQLRVPGQRFNPLEANGQDDVAIIEKLLVNLGLTPEYTYQNKQNRVTLRLQNKHMNPLLKAGILFAAGLALGILLNLALPGAANQTFLESAINPLYNAMFRLLGFIAGPLIFLSVAWGIYGIGDAATLNVVGKNLGKRFLLAILAVTVCGALTFPLFGLTPSDSAAQGSQFADIFTLVLDLIPANIIAPFASGNTLQIIVCAMAFGIAMLFLSSSVTAVATFIEQINTLVQFLMELVNRLIPYFIFVIALQLVLSGNLQITTSIWKLLAIYIVGALLLCLAFTLLTAAAVKVSPLVLIKKSLPAFIIALTTASSVAAFSEVVETCKHKFGIDEALCSFGIPLGMVIFKTGSALYLLMVCFFFGAQFGVGYSFGWLVTAGFMAALLSIATPPVPGGGAVAYTMLFAQMGIPIDALAIALALNIVTDFIVTPTNIYNLPLVLIGAASSLGLLDEDTLRKA